MDGTAGLTLNNPDSDPETTEMGFPRASGILFHPTSLPSRFGNGDLGPEAHAFVAFSPRPARPGGRCSPSGQRATATRPISRTRRSPATRF